ncbi:unnamed protein product, partial [Porites evermanni]
SIPFRSEKSSRVPAVLNAISSDLQPISDQLYRQTCKLTHQTSPSNLTPDHTTTSEYHNRPSSDPPNQTIRTDHHSMNGEQESRPIKPDNYDDDDDGDDDDRLYYDVCVTPEAVSNPQSLKPPIYQPNEIAEHVTLQDLSFTEEIASGVSSVGG